MPLIALRVELPDIPHALASVAGVLGEHDANIVGIEIHELSGERVIDEIVVDVPEHASVAAVREGLLRSGALGVTSVPVPADQQRTDAIVRCLDAISELAADGDEAALPEVVSRIVPVDHAEIRPIEGLEFGGPELRWGITMARRTVGPDGDETWFLAVPRADMAPVPFEALVVSRAGARFSATEVSRLRALVRVHVQLSYRAGRSAVAF